MTKYTGTVNILMNDTVDIDTVDINAEVKQLKRSAKIAGKMETLFYEQGDIMNEQQAIYLEQIELIKREKKVIAKLGKIK